MMKLTRKRYPYVVFFAGALILLCMLDFFQKGELQLTDNLLYSVILVIVHKFFSWCWDSKVYQ
ncbi:hypothetical protein [Pseudalkalibacillus hwajinpoensis]|uniref:hypothetical protein n=1 Tax=Guptibacillus hwajinpoensis TaxID=208199 RepID=UPI001CFDF72E|nr:hypothetical protein [Pseudalkalibacillus hwajinpoensis]